MEDAEYTSKIDAFTPDSLPMARLAEYLAALADLIGHKASTHFVRLERGSTKLVHKVEATDAPKVERRLRDVIDGAPQRMRAEHSTPWTSCSLMTMRSES